MTLSKTWQYTLSHIDWKVEICKKNKNLRWSDLTHHRNTTSKWLWFPIDCGMIQKCLLGAGMTVLADLISQNLVETKSIFDWQRTSRFGLVSFFQAIPNNWWMLTAIPVIWKTKYFKKLSPNLVAIHQIGIDLSLKDPLNIVFYLWCNSYMRTYDVEVSNKLVQDMFWTNYKNSMMFGSVIGFVNHRFVPMHYKIYFGMVVGFSFRMLLIYINFETLCENGQCDEGPDVTPDIAGSRKEEP
jgi:hypothetical protein